MVMANLKSDQNEKKAATTTTTENKFKMKKVVRTMHRFNVFIFYAYVK